MRDWLRRYVFAMTFPPKAHLDSAKKPNNREAMWRVQIW